MNAILHCVRKSCFLDDDDDDDDNSHGQETPRSLRVVGRDVSSPPSSVFYQPPIPSNSHDDDDDDDDDFDGDGGGQFTHDTSLDNGYERNNFNSDRTDGGARVIHNERQEGEDLTQNGEGSRDGRHMHRNQPMNSILSFFNNIRNPLNGDRRDRGHTTVPSSKNGKMSDNEGDHLLTASPLKEATLSSVGFDNIPTIALSEVVLPGSLLQKQMSMMLKNKGYVGESEEDECVICMEGFDETNPRMPTLCGCGSNQTYFHLPCLYHWIEQSRDCPSCRKKLSWQEF